MPHTGAPISFPKPVVLPVPDFSMMNCKEAADWCRIHAAQQPGLNRLAEWLEEMDLGRKAIYEAQCALAKAKW
jgi:hypothetical protein